MFLVFETKWNLKPEENTWGWPYKAFTIESFDESAEYGKKVSSAKNVKA
jgi:hypothetical protein